MEIPSIFKREPKTSGPERKSTEDEERNIRRTAGFVNMRVVSLMYIRASSEDKEIKEKATLTIEAISGALEMMMKGITRFRFDRGVYDVGKVVTFDPEKFDLHFNEVTPGEQAVIVNPPMIEGANLKPYTTKPTVVSLESVKESYDKYKLALESGRGIYLYD